MTIQELFKKYRLEYGFANLVLCLEDRQRIKDYLDILHAGNLALANDFNKDDIDQLKDDQYRSLIEEVMYDSSRQRAKGIKFNKKQRYLLGKEITAKCKHIVEKSFARAKKLEKELAFTRKEQQKIREEQADIIIQKISENVSLREFPHAEVEKVEYFTFTNQKESTVCLNVYAICSEGEYYALAQNDNQLKKISFDDFKKKQNANELDLYYQPMIELEMQINHKQQSKTFFGYGFESIEFNISKLQINLKTKDLMVKTEFSLDEEISREENKILDYKQGFFKGKSEDRTFDLRNITRKKLKNKISKYKSDNELKEEQDKIAAQIDKLKEEKRKAELLLGVEKTSRESKIKSVQVEKNKEKCKKKKSPKNPEEIFVHAFIEFHDQIENIRGMKGVNIMGSFWSDSERELYIKADNFILQKDNYRCININDKAEIHNYLRDTHILCDKLSTFLEQNKLSNMKKLLHGVTHFIGGFLGLDGLYHNRINFYHNLSVSVEKLIEHRVFFEKARTAIEAEEILGIDNSTKKLKPISDKIILAENKLGRIQRERKELQEKTKQLKELEKTPITNFNTQKDSIRHVDSLRR